MGNFFLTFVQMKVLVKKDKEGNTPFHLAAASGDVETLENFIFYYELETGTGEMAPERELLTLSRLFLSNS